jgi:hypothetical protein
LSKEDVEFVDAWNHAVSLLETPHEAGAVNDTEKQALLRALADALPGCIVPER